MTACPRPGVGNEMRSKVQRERAPLRVVRGGAAPRKYRDADCAIRVVVVDDHPLIRAFVRFACEASDDVEVVGEASSGLDALDVCRSLRPDVVVLDVFLPAMDGFEVAQRLKGEGMLPRVLMLSGSDDPENLFRCRRVGVDGYLLKTAGLTEVVDAIRAAAQRGWSFDPAHEQAVHRRLGDLVRRSREAHRLAGSLTVRQREVLELLNDGLSTRQIASRLSISQGTAEAHIGAIFRKLQAGTRLQAVTRAVALGLLAPDSSSRLPDQDFGPLQPIKKV